MDVPGFENPVLVTMSNDQNGPISAQCTFKEGKKPKCGAKSGAVNIKLALVENGQGVELESHDVVAAGNETQFSITSRPDQIIEKVLRKVFDIQAVQGIIKLQFPDGSFLFINPATGCVDEDPDTRCPTYRVNVDAGTFEEVLPDMPGFDGGVLDAEPDAGADGAITNDENPVEGCGGCAIPAIPTVPAENAPLSAAQLLQILAVAIMFQFQRLRRKKIKFSNRLGKL